METQKLASLMIGCLVVVGLTAACEDDDPAEVAAAHGGSGGKGSTGSAGGGNSKAGAAGKGGGEPIGIGGVLSSGGAGGDPSVGGEPASGGNAATGNGAMGGDAGSSSTDGGQAGEGGEGPVSCDTVRAELLAPIDSVSTGLVENLSPANATSITLRVDASAGGYMAAASNPYIYVNLAGGLRADVSDVAADGSDTWDLAFKRDNIRSNSGDSGPGAAEVAVLDGANFDAVTAAEASTASFGADDFVDDVSCEPVSDAIGKPLTRFDGWYDYDGATMSLAPAHKVFLVRAAKGAAVYKLELQGYYVDLSDGMGGTVKKSAVYTFRYAAL